MSILAPLLAGSFIGAVLGFVGAGGAMLSVPILMYIFDFTPQAATTAALAIVFAAALSGAIPKARKKEILYREALTIWSLGLLTNIGFSLIVDRLSSTFITTGLSLVLLFAATSMLQKPLVAEHKRMSLPTLIFVSLVIGSITGIFGIGGGFLAIPVLVLAFGTPHKIAAGTSLVIISLNSLTAFLGHHKLWNEVNWHVPIVMAIAAVTVAWFASKNHHRINDALLRKAFAFLLYSVAAFTLIESWFI